MRQPHNIFKLRHAFAAAGCATLIAGCAAGPDYARPNAALPTAYTAGASEPPPSAGGADDAQRFDAALDIPAQWWQLFHSAALNQLIEASLQHNPTVEAAQAALRSARENVDAQQGAFYPTVDASYAPTRQKVAGTLASPLASNAYYYNLHTAQVTVSYVPDLFGANRRQVESLQAQAESQRYQIEATSLTLTANVANAAIEYAMLDAQIAATREMVGAQTTLLTMARRQLALGQVAQADVATQEAALAASEVALPALQKQLAVQRNLLTALAGRYPGDGTAPSFDLDALQLPATLPLTLPASLVEHRPDVRAAEAELQAASAQVGVAAANRLPNITLGVNAWGSSASTLGELFKSGTGFWSLAASVAQPVFDGGALKHRQGAAQAAYEQAAAQYRGTVITAFQNVADALNAIEYDAVALRAATSGERAAAKSLGIGKRQLALGDISPMALLASEQASQQARFNLAQARANRLADTVALFQALGGGWWNRGGG
ncbi:efflux transporter outer membrane subunit [Rugamonas sp.]|uniref:efflux transporter outer membrane subunit n=1 Tax=Rugamonas sp. TaxID=1926287 RepID=UPI0025E6496D|nr:efflux transporter outer membrane subunit [Rugamonas sp.]